MESEHRGAETGVITDLESVHLVHVDCLVISSIQVHMFRIQDLHFSLSNECCTGIAEKDEEKTL
jgi:hypothetical protein